VAGTHRELVVYVHGLWLSGGEALFLRRRLERDFEFEVIAFTYPSVSSCMSEIVERLHSFVEEHPAPVVHFVGHSLGGIVVHRFLERFDDAVPQCFSVRRSLQVARRLAWRDGSGSRR
jgi:predicted alpha/beta hydrolase family esterase